MKHPALRRQRGMTMLVVLIMMSVLLMGALALARMTEASYLITGNVASRDASVHAAEVGWTVAFNAVQALPPGAEEVGIANWYWPTPQPADAAGVPQVNWANAAQVAGNVGRYDVRYVVERLCTVAPVIMASRQCLVKEVPEPPNRNHDAPEIAEANSRQFRITVRVTDQRGTQTLTQSLVTKAN